MLIQLDKWAFKPVRKWVRDAGWDLLSPETVTIQPHSYYEIDTGVHFAIPRGYVGMVKTKSSFIKQHVLTEGVVDSGYIGSVHVFINNMSDNSLNIERGQKVAQIVFLPIYEVGNMEVVENLQDFEVKNERGVGGFGSTGK